MLNDIKCTSVRTNSGVVPADEFFKGRDFLHPDVAVRLDIAKAVLASPAFAASGCWGGVLPDIESLCLLVLYGNWGGGPADPAPIMGPESKL